MLARNSVTKLSAMLKFANENVDTDLGLLQAISLGRALATNGGDRDLKTVQLNGYPETLSSGARAHTGSRGQRGHPHGFPRVAPRHASAFGFRLGRAVRD